MVDDDVVLVEVLDVDVDVDVDVELPVVVAELVAEVLVEEEEVVVVEVDVEEVVFVEEVVPLTEPGTLGSEAAPITASGLTLAALVESSVDIARLLMKRFRFV